MGRENSTETILKSGCILRERERELVTEGDGDYDQTPRITDFHACSALLPVSPPNYLFTVIHNHKSHANMNLTNGQKIF
ncbi:hypothetical protein SADUNF_Sadunf03G0028900 [Salix dunnii]|uniref:Uncharacterized protein n=1 Tax=Salix dunnii TaxID=1413687 RepID=A0A835N039_9ROSI|nr:hypothetical protein SADUNF_Sadunf03G0028900 [Salix dunnii]